MAGDPLPADVALKSIMESMEFELKLAPLPRTSGGKAPAKPIDDGSDDGEGQASSRKRRNRRRGSGAQGSGQPGGGQRPLMDHRDLELRFLRAAAAGFPAGGVGGPLALPDAPRAGGGGGAGRGGKGGKQGGGKGSSTAFVPKALSPGVGKLANGEPICFGFNLGTCSASVAPGGRCPRGHHVCTKIGCQRAHRASECTL